MLMTVGLLVRPRTALAKAIARAGLAVSPGGRLLFGQGPRQPDVGFQRRRLGSPHERRANLDDRQARKRGGSQAPGALPSNLPPHL
jgi:hypothetical protein